MTAATDSVAQENPQELVPAPLSAEDAHGFWRTFLEQEAQLADLPSQECVEQANQMMQNFSSSLTLEVEGGEGGEGAGRRGLVITAHGSKEHFADILLLQDMAPAMRAFSPVTAFRRRASDGSFDIRMDGFGLSTDEVLCQLFVDAGLAGIALRFDREIPMDMVDHARRMAFIMLDHVIGEYDFAVRVGPVEFVEAFDSEGGPSVRLSQLADAFDKYWRKTLGRTGELPVNEDERLWDMLTLQPEKEGDRPDILSHYRSANALATRADLAFCVDVTVSVDDQDLERARDLQDALAKYIEDERQGIHVMSLVRLNDALRTCTFYVESAHAWREAFEGICRNLGFSGAQIDVRFDPSWDAYLAYWRPPEA